MNVKDIKIAPIASTDARVFIRKHHYSGSVANNSQLHFGVFIGERLEGVMQFGPSMDKSKLIGLVSETGWNGFIELNRLAFTSNLPRNSESRALSVAFRLIKKHYPHIKWIVSFADGTQCGDGTIYRASGFVLTGIKKSHNLARFPDGRVVHKLTYQSNPSSPRRELGGRCYFDITGGKQSWLGFVNAMGAEILAGFQLRYIYFLDPEYRNKLTVPTLPFSEIDRVGARMYRGKPCVGNVKEHSGSPAESGGAIPTPTLHKANV